MSAPIPPEPRPPSQIIESIDTKAATVRDAAQILTKCIEQFEEYLSRVSGRVEAKHFGRHPDRDGPGDPRELVLKFHRSGKSWIISCADYHPQYHEDHPMEWTPLKESSLKLKIAGVRMFPELLESIEIEQDSLVKRIRRTTNKHVEFMSTLPPVGKERDK
jgi:hypothetical protein